jgi:hypothetical protein
VAVVEKCPQAAYIYRSHETVVFLAVPPTPSIPNKNHDQSSQEQPWAITQD